MMWMILQAEVPEDWVIATGETTSVRDFIKMAFAEIGVTLRFEGTGVDEKGFVESSTSPKFAIKVGQEVVSIDPNYFRPTEVDLLVGDATKAKEKLGWVPEYSLGDLVKEMMQSDIKLMQKEQYLKEGGYTTLNYFE
jgi:GDPmannose 4,6-dehydratase